MAENQEKDIPIKEQADGSVLAAVGTQEDPFVEEENKAAASAEEEGEEEEGEGEEYAEGGEVENQGETEDDREAIREARREERKLKKELSKQREATARNKITALERRNEELAKRLASLESTAASYQFAQLDKAIEDEATRIEYAKMKMMQAAQTGDAVSQVEFLDQLTESKGRLAQIQAYKKHQLEQASRPRQNVPNPISTEVQRNATGWLTKNKWYDPQARDVDSRIAKVVDQDLAAEGWDPADPGYWDELDNRLSARLPHRYASKGEARRSRPNATASSRSANPTGKTANTITLSPDRVAAIKDAGAWDDPVKRSKMIKAYAAYDRANRT